MIDKRVRLIRFAEQQFGIGWHLHTGALGEHALENLARVAPEAPALGLGPDYVEVDARSDAGSWVYVVDGNGNTLTVLTGPPAAVARVLLPDGGLKGLGLALDGGYVFGPNTVPEPYARVGNEIFVPLYGGFPPTQATTVPAWVETSKNTCARTSRNTPAVTMVAA